MKKTKLLTSIAALALVLGLGACEVNVDVGGVDVGDVDVGVDVNPNDSSEDTSEDESTSESTSENESTSESTSEGNTSESTSEGDTSENTSESGSTSESTSEPEPEPEPVDYAIVGDFTDSSWNENPATDSIYYISAETEKYEVEVTIADQGSNTWDAGLRVVEYGTWTTAVGYTELDSASTGVWQGSKDNNIAVNWGATYDLVITLGDNPSILVTLQEEEEEGTGEGPDLEIAQAILDAADDADYNGLSWSAFHAEYIDESYDETKTSYLTTDSDGLYGSILDYDTGDLTFAYYYQGGLEYVYGVTGDYHEVDESSEDYDDLLDDYTGTAIGDAFLLDVEDDDITLNELDNGYELIVNTTDMVDFKVADVEYVYITDFEYNIIGVGYGVSASGDFEGWYAEETTYDSVVTSMADFDPTLWAEEEEEETYLFGFELDGTLNYIDGGTIEGYSYEGTFTTNVDDAVRVSVEDGETAGEYYLSFDLNGTTYWITIIESSGHINLSYAETASPLYWNATYNCWGDNTLSYFLCYYKNTQYNYECLYCSALTYVSSSPIAGLYTEDGVACTEGLVGYELPAPTKITVSGRETLYIGNTTQLSVTVEPANAVADVTWSSSSDAIANVSDTGLVEGIADGTATITATSVKDTSVSGSIDIVVSEAPAGVTEVKLGTYDFSTKTKDFCSSNGGTNTITTTQLKTTLDTYWTSEGGYSNPLSSVTSTGYIYQYYTSGGLHPNEYNFLKTGTGSYNGTMDLSMSETITKVEIDQQSWSTSENCTITVNNGAGQESASKGVEQTLTFDIDETTNLSMTFAKRCYIFSITLYGYAA